MIDSSAFHDGLNVIDVSDPTAPWNLETNYGFYDDAYATGVIGDEYVLVAQEDDYFDIIDVTDPGNPVSFNDSLYPDEANSLDVSGDYMLLTHVFGGISVWSLADLTDVFEIFTYAIDAEHGVLEGDIAYLANGGEFSIVKIDAIGGSGEAGEAVIADINAEIADGGQPDSIRHHQFTLSETTTLTIELVSGDFDSWIYLFEDTGAGLVYVDDNDDFNGLLSGLNITLNPGTYDVAVGGYYLNEDEAHGTVNTDSSGEYGNYNLKISVSPKVILSSLEIDAEITDLEVVGKYAYLNTVSSGIYIFDISNPQDPVQTGRHNYTGYSPYPDGGLIDVQGDRVYLLDGVDGMVIMDLTQDLLITGETRVSGGIEYQLAWSIDRILPQAQVKCAVISGDCMVTNVDHVNRTATVHWTPPEYSGDYGIVFAVGNHNSYTSTRARVHWQGSLGENPQSEELEIGRFYGVLAQNGLYGSVQHHNLAISASSFYRYEVSSIGFAPQAYVFNSYFEDDTDDRPEVFENELYALGNYSLTIGSYPLGLVDAWPYDWINTNPPASIGDGLYEIRAYRLFGRPVTAAPGEEPS
jgi:hypothetical protein